jgi:hypothetical protein
VTQGQKKWLAIGAAVAVVIGGIALGAALEGKKNPAPTTQSVAAKPEKSATVKSAEAEEEPAPYSVGLEAFFKAHPAQFLAACKSFEEDEELFEAVEVEQGVNKEEVETAVAYLYLECP